MNAELKQKWVEALRSGKYTQCIGQLRTADSYCCLGVLCDISGVGRWSGMAYKTGGNMSETLTLPIAVAVLAKINWNPVASYNEAEYFLADLNDGLAKNKSADKFIKLSFLEIADLIEQQL